MRKLFTFLIVVAAVLLVVFLEPEEKGKKRELAFWNVNDSPSVYSEFIELFEKNYPDFIIRYKQFPDYDEYEQFLKYKLKKGEGPDIFVFQPQAAKDYENYLSAFEIKDPNSFPPFALAYVKKNKVTSLPLFVDSLMMFYNKRFYPDGIQENFYDFAEQTRSTSSGVGGIAMGRVDNMFLGWDVLSALFLQEEKQKALEFFTKFADEKDKYFNWSEKLSKNYKDKEFDSFSRERVASIFAYGSDYSFLLQKNDKLRSVVKTVIKKENIGMAKFPQFHPENPKYLAQSLQIGVSKYSENGDSALKFVEFLTNEENAKKLAKLTSKFSGRMIPVEEADSEVSKIQKKQILNANLFVISDDEKEKLSSIVDLH